MEHFTAEQQAYLDSMHKAFNGAVDMLEKKSRELYYAIEGVKAILAFKQVATMEELEGKAREMRVAADLMKLSDPTWIALEELRKRIV